MIQRDNASGTGDAGWAYTVAEPRVIHEEIDGEVLAIDNDTGTYLSLRGPAVPLWRALAAGASRADLCEAVAATHRVTQESVRPVLDRFVEQLSDLGVLAPIDPDASAHPVLEEPDELGTVPHPVVEVFSDLQKLLLFDPIHEVDDAGWPHAAN